MKHSLPEIVAVGLYNAQLFHKGEVTKPRTTTMFELELVLDEGGTTYIDGENQRIDEGLIICAKPGQRRHTRLPFRCLYVHLIVTEGTLYEHLLALPTFIRVPNVAPYREILENICRAYDTALATEMLLAQSELLRFCYLLSCESKKSAFEPKAHNGAAIESVIEYIDSHLTEELSLQKLAALASFSPVHFHNCFRKATGTTLRTYVEQRRIRRAATLLVTTERTLAEIAQDCGFSSQAYFSFVFKRAMKETPRAYALRMHREYER